eukprot:scaffold30376_cov42-Attheya_sp.AAC.1
MSLDDETTKNRFHFQNLSDVSEFSPDVGYDIGSVRYEIRSSQQTGNKPRTGRLAFMKQEFD